MKVLILVPIVAVLVWWGVRLTRARLALAGADAGAVVPLGFVVAVDETTGKLAAVGGDLEAMQRTWHPVRFPDAGESRSAGLPAERAYGDRGFSGRRGWCEEHCKGRWRLEDSPTYGLVFWFQDQRDATDFSLAWFPFKCV